MMKMFNYYYLYRARNIDNYLLVAALTFIPGILVAASAAIAFGKNIRLPGHPHASVKLHFTSTISAVVSRILGVLFAIPNFLIGVSLLLLAIPIALSIALIGIVDRYIGSIFTSIAHLIHDYRHDTDNLLDASGKVVQLLDMKSHHVDHDYYSINLHLSLNTNNDAEKLYKNDKRDGDFHLLDDYFLKMQASDGTIKPGNRQMAANTSQQSNTANTSGVSASQLGNS